MATHEDTTQTTRGRLLEYAEFIEEQVAHARARIKSNDMFRAILWIVTVTLTVLFIEILLDHLVELPLMARRGILFSGLILGLGYAWMRIARPMMMHINELYAAKSIETVDPKFKNSLINYLQIRDDADKVAPSVLAQMEARAVADLSNVNVDSIIDPSPVTRLSYALAALVVGFCLYSWMTPKSLLDSARRAFLADVQRPTNTRFINVRPGEDPEAPKAITGLPIEFTVETLGSRPEKVTLFTSRDGGKTFAETEMKEGRSFADPWSANFDKLPGDLLYYMAGGDGRTRTYSLTAVPVAIVEKVYLDYDFPEYTNVPRREGIEEGNVEALQGTWITVTATTNQPAKSGLLDFKPLPPVPLSVVPGDPKKLTGKFLVQDNGQYAVRFNSVDGQTNPEPVLYDIKVVKDLSPTARFIRPESPTQRPANARVPLVIEASDDFGLMSAQLHVHKNGEILQQAEELVDPKAKPTLKQIQRTVSLDLLPLSLKPGDKIQYWLTLRDNCDIQPNKFETPKQVIEILDPVSEPKREELAKNEMAQAEEQTGQQDPMNDNQPEQNQNDQQQKDGQSGNQQQKNQKNQGKSEDQPKDSNEQQGKGKNGQGDQSESADPSNNAKQGGQEAKDPQQHPGDSSKNSPKSQQKNAQNKSGSGSQKNQDQEKQEQEKQEPGENQTQSGGDQKSGDNSKSNAKNKQQNQPGQQDQPGDQKNADQSKNSPEDQKGENASQTPKNADNSQKPAPNEKPKGQNQPGEQQQGEKGENQSEKPENQQQPGNEKSTGEKPMGDKTQSTGEKPMGDKTQSTGEKPMGDKSSAGDKGQQQQGANSEKGLPDGDPQSASQGEKQGGQGQDTKDLSQADRKKLDKLKEALGLNDKPAGDESQKPQDGAGNDQMSPKNDGQNKGEDAVKQGENAKEQENQGKSAASSEKPMNPDQPKAGTDSSSNDTEKQTGEKNADQPASKSGGDKSNSADQEKGQGLEKGQGQEKGKAQQKGEGQEKGQAQEKGEAQQKGEGQEKGQGQEKGKAQQKGEGQEKGQAQQKGAGQQKGESQQKGEAQQKSEGESGKSQESGEKGDKPGGLPKDTPKTGGMREGNETPENQPDTSTPSPRAVEPENSDDANLTTSQKADQRLLKRLREMVDKNEITKELEQATGLSREEIDQFVRKFEPPANNERTGAAGTETTDITATPGKEQPDRKVNLPANLPGGQVTSRTGRGSGMIGEDQIQGNLEGTRSRVPSALRSRFEAYQKGLSRAGRTTPANQGSGTNTGTGSGGQNGSGSDR